MSDAPAGATENEVLDDTIEGAVNLRDIGGLPARGGRVRRRLVYRSGMMHHISEGGLAALAGELGVRTVIDLRSESEIESDGLSPFGEHGIAHRHLPVHGSHALDEHAQAERMRQFLEGTVAWGDAYLSMASERGEVFRAFFEILAEPGGLAAVFHCSGGRDRTGIAAALLLATLGVGDEVIAADYARTGAHLKRHVPRFARYIDGAQLTQEQFAILVETSGSDILAFLSALKAEHGSVGGYLDAIGVPTATRASVRRIMIEAE